MDKKRFVLRIDAEAMGALERWAADEFRSVNGQLEYLLARALREAGREPRGRGRPRDGASTRHPPSDGAEVESPDESS